MKTTIARGITLALMCLGLMMVASAPSRAAVPSVPARADIAGAANSLVSEVRYRYYKRRHFRPRIVLSFGYVPRYRYYRPYRYFRPYAYYGRPYRYHRPRYYGYYESRGRHGR